MKTALLLVLSLLPQAAGDGWWDAAWKQRRRISLRNNHDRALPAGFTVEMELDAGYLGIAAKAKAGLADLALVHRGKRLPCLVLDGRRPTLLFRTAADLGAGQADDGYALYYGNPEAAAPAVRRSDVVDFAEDFSDPARFAERFAPDPEVRCAVEGGALVLQDVDAGRTPEAPGRIVLKAGAVPPGFALSFDVEFERAPATPAGVAVAVDLKDPAPPVPDLGKKVDELIAALADDAWEAREKATRELIRLGKPAMAKLLAATRGGDAEVRWRAEHALREIREKTAPPVVSAGIAAAGPASMALPAAIGKYRPVQAWRGPVPSRLRVTIERDPEGDVRIAWNGQQRQTGELKGEVEQIAITAWKTGAMTPVRLDNFEIRRFLDDDSKPTHTVDVEESRP
jgi:hypothetical protein